MPVLSSADVHMFHLKPDMKMSAAGLASVTWTITLETQYESAVTDDVTREEFCAYECHFMYPSCHAFNVDYVSGNCTLMSSDIDPENLVYDMDFSFFLGLDGESCTPPPFPEDSFLCNAFPLT